MTPADDKREASPHRPVPAPVRLAGRVLDWLENVAAVIAGVMLVASLATVLLEVFSRQFLDRSYEWVIEMNENMLVWVVLLAAAWVLREGGHVRVDLFEGLMNPAVRRANDVLIAVLGIAVAAVIVWFGAESTFDAFESGRVTLTSARLPEAWIILAIPIGGALLGLEFLRQGLRALTGRASTLEGPDVAV